MHHFLHRYARGLPRSPSVFGLFLLSFSVTLAHDIRHHFFPFVEHNSLSGPHAFVPVPLVSVCCSAFFPFAEHNLLSGWHAVVPIPLESVCCSAFFPFAEHNLLSGRRALVPIPLEPVPACECVEQTSKKIL